MVDHPNRKSGWGFAWLALGLLCVRFSDCLAFEPATPVMAPLPTRAIITPVMECSALRFADLASLPDAPTSILDAKVEAAVDQRPEFCSVKGYVAPNVQFELRLPTRTWTGRYLQGGCGGNCGVIVNQLAPRCDTALAYGGAFALGFENSGHTGRDGVWARAGGGVREDFAYRAAHVFSIAAKAIIRAYYGQTPQFAYFQGCSDGGREAMMESQRYPDDFDGIIAGSPAFAITEALERFIWEAKWNHDAKGERILDEASIRLLHGAVVSACDKLDGLVDGQLDDPRRCRFDPAKLQCPAHAKREVPCLTTAQVEVAQKFYAGPTDETGQHLFYGGEAYGSELSWLEPYALSQAGPALLRDAARDMVFEGSLPADVTVNTWKFDHATFSELQRHGSLFDANNPDLTAFRQRHGKLILWQGFADPAAGAYGLADYYARVATLNGGYESTRGFVRMFLVPGVYHCGGGYIPYEEDFLGALALWVESGAAPDSVLASARLGDGPIRTRPIFAYPFFAHYKGHGDINSPEAFTSESAIRDPAGDRYPWAGADH